jgi:succinoglycan biosynthesis protein ExoO
MDSIVQPPEVSVIIAAYNVQNYIERTVQSALDQQDVTVEIIVVDDASTDDTAKIVSHIDDPRVKLLRRTQNGGPSLARNEALAVAKSPWIAILDGDDVFMPDRLKRCLHRAEAAAADIVVDNLEIYREEDGARIPMFRDKDFGSKPSLDLATFIKGNMSFLGSTSLGYVKPIFSAEFLKNNNLRYDPGIRIGEDYMLLAEALALGARCVIEGTPGYVYTVRKGSISHRLSVADIERMQAGDKLFLAKYKLDQKAQKAQKWRNFSLNEALAFTQLVDAIKQKHLISALRIIAIRPSAAFHLWRPVGARLQRLFKKVI